VVGKVRLSIGCLCVAQISTPGHGYEPLSNDELQTEQNSSPSVSLVIHIRFVDFRVMLRGYSTVSSMS
jgi:hypothetical protein